MTFISILRSGKCFPTLLFFFTSVFVVKAQNISTSNIRLANSAINKLIGGSDNEYYSFGYGQNVNISATTDGGYIVVGSTKSTLSGDITFNNKGENDFLVIKLAANGTIQWHKLIGGNKDEIACTILQTPDGGYILGGSSSSSVFGDITATNNGSYDYSIIKLSASGSVEWSKLYGGSSSDELQNLKLTSDGGFIVCGYSFSTNSGDVTETNHGLKDFWIVKLKSDGTIQWKKLIGGDGSDHAFTIQQIKDGGYIVSGVSNTNNNGDIKSISNGYYDFIIVKLDVSGNIVWDKLYGTAKYEDAYTIEQTPDEGFIVAGATQSANIPANTWPGGLNGLVMKLDASGDKVWEKAITGTKNEMFIGLTQTGDGSYICVGYSESNDGDIPTNNHGLYDFWAVKINSTGSIVWNKLYGGTGDDRAFSIIKNADGNFIIVGTSTSSVNGDIIDTNKGLADIWLLTVDVNGDIVTNTAQKTDLSLKSRSNNPVVQKDSTGTISFTLKNQSNTNATNIKVLLKIPYTPPFVIKDSQNCSKGTFDSNTWTIPALAAGDSCILNVVYQPIQSGVWYVEAEVFSADQEDSDSKPNNAIESEDDFTRMCFSIPIKVSTEPFGMQLILEDPKLTAIQWYKDGQTLRGENKSTLQITALGKYSYTSQNYKCPEQGCCPFILEKAIVAPNCCTPLEYLLERKN